MSRQKATKALFRCLWAYSNGRPVVSYELEEYGLRANKKVCAIRDTEVTLRVAVIRGSSLSNDDASDRPELLGEAYERYIDDGEESANIEWVKL